MAKRILIETPARLHFGLVNPFNRNYRLYISAGIAIDKPRTVVSVYLDKPLSIEGCRSGEIYERLRGFIEKYEIRVGHVVVEECIPKHIGLGSTTQLLLSIVHGLSIANKLNIDLVEAAGEIGLAKISGVGTYVYIHGGFVVDSGKRDPGEFPRLLIRLPVPETWRFIVIVPEGRGLDEEAEMRIFQGEVDVDENLIWYASYLLFAELIPSLVENRFDEFSQALSRLQETVGKMFSRIQGGVFTPYSSKAIESLKKIGVVGVGQSSWGPAVYGVLDSEDRARHVYDYLVRELDDVSIVIARPRNTGARVRITS